MSSEHDTDLTEREREIFEIGKTITENIPFDPSTEKPGFHYGNYTQVKLKDGTRIEEHPIEPNGEPVVHIHRTKSD